MFFLHLRRRLIHVRLLLLPRLLPSRFVLLRSRHNLAPMVRVGLRLHATLHLLLSLFSLHLIHDTFIQVRASSTRAPIFLLLFGSPTERLVHFYIHQYLHLLLILCSVVSSNQWLPPSVLLRLKEMNVLL